MSSASDSAVLYEAIKTVYARHADRDTINPAWLATEVMIDINFPRELHPLGYLGCHLELRQMARQFCRKHFDPIEDAEDDLFPETLQKRYPKAPTDPDAEPVYLAFEKLTYDDFLYNIARLRKEAAAKMRHAEALEAAMFEKFPPLHIVS